MLSDFHTVSKLKVELAALVDGAQPFLKACYTSEGVDHWPSVFMMKSSNVKTYHQSTSA